MKRFTFITIALASALIITSCEKEDEINQISLLKRSWTQSYEEKSSEDIEIYRPSDYKDFPSGWYRQVFYFDDDNVCEYLVLAADDAHFMATGTWEFNDKTNMIKIFSSNSKLIYEFELLGVTGDLLKMKAKHKFLCLFNIEVISG